MVRRPSTSYAAAACLLLGVLLAGCSVGDDDTHLSGTEVAHQAEHELRGRPHGEKGTMICGSLHDVKGARTRCTRTVDTNGVVVKRGISVTITQGGHPYKLHVVADARPTEFGVSGDALGKDLAEQYSAKYNKRPDQVICPYLRGHVGTTVTCRVTVDKQERDVTATVGATVPSTSTTRYTFDLP